MKGFVGCILQTVAALLLALSCADSAFAFEDTKVLPKGIRRVSLRFVTTSPGQQTDGSANAKPLASPLLRNLTFRDALQDEKNNVKRAQLETMMLKSGFSKDSVLGRFDADLQSRINVYAPLVTYGVTNNLTFAVGVPIYSAATQLSLGFFKDSNADTFTSFFQDNRELNAEESGQEAAQRLNSAKENLNRRAVENGRLRLDENSGRWSKTGLGDINMLAKYRFHDGSVSKGALTVGAVAPTGRVDDPYILTDVPFGDGQWDCFLTLAFDEVLTQGTWGNLVFNEYARYTVQFADQKKVALLTAENTPLDAPIATVTYKLGDRVDLGAALLFESNSGVLSGVGYNYGRKFEDVYRGAGVAKESLERDTDVVTHQAEMELGYTSIPAFQRNEFPVPFETKLSYKHLVRSRNSPITHFLQIESGVFF